MGPQDKMIKGLILSTIEEHPEYSKKEIYDCIVDNFKIKRATLRRVAGMVRKECKEILNKLQ